MPPSSSASPYGALLLLLLLAACAQPPRAAAAPAEAPIVAGYLAGWRTGAGGARIGEIPAERLTHVIYAFGLVGADGRAELRDPCVDVGDCATAADSARVGTGGNFSQLRRLEARHPHLRTLIALGGWSGSARFSDVALTDSSRRRFVESVLDLYIRRWPGLFDGVDIDWEYPVGGGLATNAARPEDRRNFTLLLEEFRRALDAQGRRDGRRYLLTAATSAGPRAVTDLELGRVAELLDWFNVMTYDYHVGSPVAHFNAPLYAPEGDPTPAWTVDATMRRYLDAGVPPERLVLGIPFYARAFGGVGPTDAGRFQPADAAPPPWNTALDLATLAARLSRATGFERHWDEVARVPWLHDPARGVWITYEDARSVREKAAYAREHKLGGAMIWEITGDDGALVRILAETLAGRE